MTRHKLVPLSPSSGYQIFVGWDPALRSYYLDSHPAGAVESETRNHLTSRAKPSEEPVLTRLLGRYYGEVENVDELIAAARTHAYIPDDLDIVLRADPARRTRPPAPRR